MTERPKIVTEEHLEFLDDLRESGVTNMYGAGGYLSEEFEELDDREDARKVLSYWMKTFSKRHPRNEVAQQKKVSDYVETTK